MLPIDTNYDSLQVYYDYLEDNSIDTSELRESLENQVIIWDFIFIDSYGVGGFEKTIAIGSDYIMEVEVGDEIDYIGSFPCEVGGLLHNDKVGCGS